MICNTPLVSVLLPVYNAERFLDDCIQSILKQSYINFELILINDGSTDASNKIINSYSDHRIRAFDFQNQGLVKSLNWGLTQANGKFVARMDADDIMHEERLTLQVEFLLKFQEIDIVGTSAWAFSNSYSSPNRKIAVPISPNSCEAQLFFSTCFIHPSIMMRVETLRSVNFKYIEDGWPEDHVTFYNFRKVLRYANISAPLLFYREHPDSITITSNADNSHKYVLYKELNVRILSDLNLNSEFLEIKFLLGSISGPYGVRVKFRNAFKFYLVVILKNFRTRQFPALFLNKLFLKKLFKILVRLIK